MRETGGLELASTITLALQANQLTTCASNLNTRSPFTMYKILCGGNSNYPLNTEVNYHEDDIINSEYNSLIL